MTVESMTVEQLESTIVDARKELARRAAGDPWAAMKGRELVKRALTVAGVQGHTVVVIGRPDDGLELAVDAGRIIGVPVKIATPCPCGKFSDPRVSCSCKPAAIQKHWQRQRERIAAEIWVQATPVPHSYRERGGTTLGQARDSLSRAGSVPSGIDSMADRILAQATSELGIPVAIRDRIISVAGSVAALSQSDCIKVEHMVEAIQYRTPVN